MPIEGCAGEAESGKSAGGMMPVLNNVSRAVAKGLKFHNYRAVVRLQRFNVLRGNVEFSTPESAFHDGGDLILIA
jgi:hypothetical protein